MDVLFVYHEVVISSNVSEGRGETKKKKVWFKITFAWQKTGCCYYNTITL